MKRPDVGRDKLRDPGQNPTAPGQSVTNAGLISFDLHEEKFHRAACTGL
jgi:hypothetical protein